LNQALETLLTWGFLQIRFVDVVKININTFRGLWIRHGEKARQALPYTLPWLFPEEVWWWLGSLKWNRLRC